MTKSIRVEVALALPDEQILVGMSIENAATIADAIAKSGLVERFSAQQINAMQVGVWGRPASRDLQLKDGDRVELYRPLQRDPRDARRELAQSGLTMRTASRDNADP